MIIRIVKLTFKPEEIENFKVIFESVKVKIKSFDGCHKLDLLQDISDPRICFTYSYWESEKHLDAYRHSDFFGSTWKKTKKLFDDAPKAWSVQQINQA